MTGIRVEATAADRKPIGLVSIGGERAVGCVLRSICSRSGDFECRASFTTGAEALKALPRMDVQLLVADLELPDGCGVQLVRQLRRARPGLRSVLTMSAREEALLRRALSAGVSECLIKPFHPAQCLAALWAAVRGLAAAGLEKSLFLKAIELHVLGLLAQGHTYKETETLCGLTTSGLKRVQHRLYEKLVVHSRTEAVNKFLALTGCLPGLID